MLIFAPVRSYRWRVTRRPNQLTQRIYREDRLAQAAAASAEQLEQLDVRLQPRRPPRTRSERNDEIRRTLRSLRSGLDMVMANLNSVRRQIDNDVGRGLGFDVLENEFVGARPYEYNYYNLRATPQLNDQFCSRCPETRRLYAQQRPRLTHYIMEPNVGHGFIKELCFSADGRLVGSPYKQGVRILAFDSKCSEMSHCTSRGVQRLQEVAHIKDCHRNSVVSTKFSPTHPLLVSGSLDGKITWHQPVL